MRFFILFLLAAVTVAARGSSSAPSMYQSFGEIYTKSVACNQVISKTATFCSGKVRRGLSCVCQNDAALASLAGCQNNGAKPKFDKRLYKYCKDYVPGSNFSKQRFFEAYENFTKYAVHTSDIENFNKSKPIDVPIYVDQELRSLYIKGYAQFYNNFDHTLYYGAGLIAFWGVVFLCSGFSHWSKILFPSLVRNFTGPASNAYRKYVTMPALISKRKNQGGSLFILFDYLLPSRVETIVVFLYGCLMIFCCSHDIKYVKNDPIFDSRTEALERYVADRTGILATYTTPLIILFAGRNNIFLWLTGSNFTTFIVYHKWASRMCFILIVVHAALYTRLIWGYYTEDMKENYLIWGTVATGSGGAMWITAIMWFRRNYYEIFLLAHITLGVFFVIGSYYHVYDLGYVQWYYATIAVWGFDRVIRLARIAWFGCPQATVTLLANETLRVEIPRPKSWKSIAGGYAFIYFIKPTYFWQSHPFTFTCIPGEGNENVVMYLKVKGGITHSLCKKLSQLPGKTTKIRVALEGPYGEATASRNYDNSVFIAGGNGIPGIYSEVTDLATRDLKQTLRLYWVIREYKSLMWFRQELEALKNVPKIETTIYVTQPTSQEGLDEMFQYLSSDSDSEKKKLLESESIEDMYIQRIHRELDHIEFKEGRPDLEGLVKYEIDLSKASTCFIACGHPLMCDDLRYIITNNLDYSKKRVDYYEQLQVWA